MKKMAINLSLLGLLLTLSSFDVFDEIEHKAASINKYENVALSLSKENRDLRFEIKRLKFEIETLKSQNNYLTIKLEKKKGRNMASRSLASVSPKMGKEDFVKFDVYQWTPSQVLAMAEKEFQGKNFEKSAQFFEAFNQNFPRHEKVNDQFLFQAGVAAFESGKHPDWVLKNLETLVEKYPASKFTRGAKLWMALTHLQLGNEKRFFSTVEEFRKKYRNTSEWKILSQHYEKIVQKYKH